MLKRIFAVAVLLFLTISTQTSAKEPLFISDITSSYIFGPYTFAQASHKIKVKSTQDEYLLTSYQLQTGAKAIIDAQAQDENGKDLDTKVTDTTINISLPKPKTFIHTRTFTLQYKLDGIFNKKGLLREITIPLIGKSEKMQMDKQTIVINYPSEWGHIQAESIKAVSEEESGGTISRIYELKDETASDLKITIGQYQLYDVELNYHLTNPDTKSAMFEVAFPPNFYSLQSVYINAIEPEPKEMAFDEDGNLIGYYELSGGQSLDIKLTGQIKIDLNSKEGERANLKEDTPYLIPDKFWDVNDPKIQEIAASLSSANDVYNYVTSTLKYSDERFSSGNVKRYGGATALEHPDEAVCMEFTDLTITLLRAIRIPAREVDGYAYVTSKNSKEKPTVSDVLHAWVQYYDQEKGWVNIDPTWGATTGRDYFHSFDNDHIIFAIKGISSQGPDPAGVYKGSDFNSKDIHITLADSSKIKYTQLNSWLDGYYDRHLPWWKKVWRFLTGLFDFL